MVGNLDATTALGRGITVKRVMAHGFAGGAFARARGDSFGSGFASGVFGKITAGRISESFDTSYAGAVASAMIGGTASVIAGGKFANGALSGAFGYLYNQSGSESLTAEEYNRKYAGRCATAECVVGFPPVIDIRTTDEIDEGLADLTGGMAAIGGGGIFGGIRSFITRNVGKWTLGSGKSAAKLANQMQKRGWTPRQITEAQKNGVAFPAKNLVNKNNSATRYTHPSTGRSVVIDDVTHEVIHVGGYNFKY